MAHPGRHLIRLCLAAATIAGTAAQPPADPTVGFRVFSTVPIDGLMFLPKPDAPPASLSFYPSARSPRYTYEGSNPLRFYHRGAGRGAADGALEVAAEVSLPADVRDKLLIFVPAGPAPGSGPSYRVFLLDDGPRLSAGSLAVINFSGLALSGSLAGKAVVLRKGLNPPFAIARSARLVLRTPFRERTYQSYAGTVELEPWQRALLILLPPFRAGSLEVQSRLLVDESAGATPAGR
jgi:hypothetical protein